MINQGYMEWDCQTDQIPGVARSQTIPGNPFCVSVGAQTDTTNICQPITIGNITHIYCNARSSYQTFPVVSLYSSNQVLINGTAVGVGTNPTAIATYPSAAVVKTIRSGSTTTTYSTTGNTRVVVGIPPTGQRIRKSLDGVDDMAGLAAALSFAGHPWHSDGRRRR